MRNSVVIKIFVGCALSIIIVTAILMLIMPYDSGTKLSFFTLLFLYVLSDYSRLYKFFKGR